MSAVLHSPGSDRLAGQVSFASGSMAKKGMDVTLLVGRLREKMEPFGPMPVAGIPSLNSNQMRVGKDLIQAELRDFKRTIAEPNSMGIAKTLDEVEKMMRGHRGAVVDDLARNNFSLGDAYCLVHGEYPKGWLWLKQKAGQAMMIVGQTFVAGYNVVKLVDDHVICFSDADVYPVAVRVRSSFTSAFTLDHKKTDAIVASHAGIQTVSRAKVSSAVLALESPSSMSSSSIPASPSGILVVAPPQPGNRISKRLSKISASYTTPPLTRAQSVVIRGPASRGQQLARRDDTDLRVQSCCTKTKLCCQNNCLYSLLKYTWNNILPDVVKEDIMSEVAEAIKEPFKEIVRLSFRTVAYVIAGYVTSRIFG